MKSGTGMGGGVGAQVGAQFCIVSLPGSTSPMCSFEKVEDWCTQRTHRVHAQVFDTLFGGWFKHLAVSIPLTRILKCVFGTL